MTQGPNFRHCRLWSGWSWGCIFRVDFYYSHTYSFHIYNICNRKIPENTILFQAIYKYILPSICTESIDFNDIVFRRPHICITKTSHTQIADKIILIIHMMYANLEAICLLMSNMFFFYFRNAATFIFNHPDA